MCTNPRRACAARVTTSLERKQGVQGLVVVSSFYHHSHCQVSSGERMVGRMPERRKCTFIVDFRFYLEGLGTQLIFRL